MIHLHFAGGRFTVRGRIRSTNMCTWDVVPTLVYNSISFTSFRSHLAAKGAGLRLSTGVSSCGSDEASAGMCTLARCKHNATSNTAFGGTGPNLHLRTGRRRGGKE